MSLIPTEPGMYRGSLLLWRRQPRQEMLSEAELAPMADGTAVLTICRWSADDGEYTDPRPVVLPPDVTAALMAAIGDWVEGERT